MAIWYGGTREGAKNVGVYMSVLAGTPAAWSPARRLVGPKETQRGLGRYIKKIGNPVLLRDNKGQIWLFYVSVSAGGWSGSAVNYIKSSDHGRTWSGPTRLISSPFFNVSTLVKGAPFLYDDGTIGLPVYHEFLGKFGELLRLNPEGRVLDKIRLSWGRSSLQPVIVPLSNKKATALMRYSGRPPRRILATVSIDAGDSWQPAEKTELPNPDSAVAAIRIRDGRILLVFNNAETGRKNLSLAVSADDARTWTIVSTLENAPDLPGTPKKFSYPYLLEASDGTIHLAYSWNRKRIRHITFNQAWLDSLGD